MSPYGIAASYWVLALSLGTLGLLFIFTAMDGLVRGKGDPPSIVMGAFFGIAGLTLLFFSVNGLWEFSFGQTATLDRVVRGWVEMATLTNKFWRLIRLS
ncbi:MAG: hypothetical protein GEEBNDBF_01154 [bacterium]|nr:hypothetical protein [bacterium]